MIKFFPLLLFCLNSINLFSQVKLSTENAAFNESVNIYLRNQKGISSEKLIKTGDSLYNQSKNDWQKIKSLFVTISGYDAQFSYKKALDVALKADSIAEENNLTFWQSRTAGQVGTLYAKIGFNKESLKYFDKAFLASSHLDLKNELVSKSMILQAESFLYQNLNDYHQTLKVNKDALSINDSLKKNYPGENFQTSSITAYVNVATSYYHLKDYKQAKKYYQLALKEIKASKYFDRSSYTACLLKTAMSELKLEKPNLDSALFYINKAKEYSKGLNDKQQELEINTTEVDYFRLKNEYKIIDSLNTKINEGYKDLTTSKIKSVESVYNENQQRHEKETFKTNNQLRNLIIFIFLLLVTIVIIVLTNKRKKQRMKKRFEEIIVSLQNKESIKSSGIPQVVLTEENMQTARLMPLEKEKELLERLIIFEEGIEYTSKNFTFSNLISTLETNSKYASYIIKTHRGKNVNDYINGLRIQYIIEKLYNNPEYLNYKISYLAELSGFSTHSHFAQVFKNIIEISPSKFIQNLISEQELKNKK